MTVDREPEVIEPVSAFDVATISLTPLETVTEFVSNLPAARLGSVVLRARQVAAALDRMVLLAEGRMIEQGIRHYIDPETREPYEMTSNARRVCDDVPGLVVELVAAGASVRSIAECVSADGLRVTGLRDLAKKLRPLSDGPVDVDDHFTWKSGPLHLKRVEDNKR